MNITDDQEDLQKAVYKQNNDVRTFYTNTTEDYYKKSSSKIPTDSIKKILLVKGDPKDKKRLDKIEELKNHIASLTLDDISLDTIGKEFLDESQKDSTGFYNMLPNPDSLDLLTEEGKKETDNKVDYGEIDWDYIDSMALRMRENTKYPPENWKKPMDIKKLAKSAIRHARKILQPVECDEETLEEHAVALGCNGFMINYQLKNK